jgi:8-oxo-dGTP pyrophosphatase MutT (NUDIX family)
VASERRIDVHKAGGIIIRDRKLLISRSKGKELFINPGGKVEGSETLKETLVRELMEESQITVVSGVGSLTHFVTINMSMRSQLCSCSAAAA